MGKFKSFMLNRDESPNPPPFTRVLTLPELKNDEANSADNNDSLVIKIPKETHFKLPTVKPISKADAVVEETLNKPKERTPRESLQLLRKKYGR